MEFIALVLDISSTDVQQLYEIIKILVQKKLFSESKDEFALIVAGCLSTSGKYKHIKIDRELERLNWKFFKYLEKSFDFNYTKDVDLLEAVVVAADHVVTKTRGRKTGKGKRIIVLSNLEGEIDWSETRTITNSLKREEIVLDVISRRDLLAENDDTNVQDDLDFKLSPMLRMNERMFGELISETEGSSYSVDDAVVALKYLTTKSVAQVGWKVNLEVSDIFTIPIVGYTKVQEVRRPSTKQVYGPDLDAEIEVKKSSYLDDTNMTEVEANDAIKGFKFGKSLIPCTEEDISRMKMTVEKSLKLIGFTEEDQIGPHLYVGNNSLFFVAQSSDEALFAALVQEMFEMNVVAVVRRVYNKASTPRLGTLSPKIKDNVFVLVYREMAFGEGIRQFQFSKLPTPTKGENNSDSKNEISSAQMNAVDKLIDEMMLVKWSETDDKTDRGPRETYRPSRMINPTINLFYNCIKTRYFDSTAELPKPDPALMANLEPPVSSVSKQSNEAAGNKAEMTELLTIRDLITADILAKFELRTNEVALAKSAKRKPPAADLFLSSNIKTAEGTGDSLIKKIKLSDNDHSTSTVIDLDTFLSQTEVTEVGSVTPIEDFSALLESQELCLAMDSMGKRIWQLVNDSYLETLYPQALKCLVEMRRQAINYSNITINLVNEFNTFLVKMKGKLRSSGKSDFWKALVKENISLICKSETEYGVEDIEKEKFLQAEETKVEDTQVKDKEMDELFDDM